MYNLELFKNGPKSSLSTWEPFERMFGDVDRWFARNREGNDLNFAPACDIKESETGYSLSFDLPGMKKEDIQIDVKGNQVTVSGERHSKNEKHEGTVHRVERQYGQFRRSFSIGEDIDVKNVGAKYEDGVLTLTIPKAPTAKSLKVKVV